VLRRYSIGVTRVAVSSEQQFSVLATSQRDAEGLVHDEASDRVFVIKVDDEVKEMALVTMLSPKK
jgi:hypothetical protein